MPVDDRAPVAEHQITVTGTAQQRAWRDRLLPPVEQVRPGLTFTSTTSVSRTRSAQEADEYREP